MHLPAIWFNVHMFKSLLQVKGLGYAGLHQLMKLICVDTLL